MREDELRTQWSEEAASRSERMEFIGDVYRRWRCGRIATFKAEELVREILEPRIVRVGEAHKPEVQT